MRFVILGAGSIGVRHLKNLLQLGQTVVGVYDPNGEKLESVREVNPTGVATDDENEMFSLPADAAIICSPTAFHLKHGLRAAELGLHLLIEKPVSHDLDGIDALFNQASLRGLTVMVGCNLRFLSSLRLAKSLLDEGKIGRPLSADAEFGFYLPYWHPWEDYRRGYSANKALGGGIILDAIHEFDFMYWLLGEVSEVFAFVDRLSGLEIDTEDNAEILLRFAAGPVGRIHLDYLQRTFSRRLKVIGEEGALVWDFVEQTVELYGRESDRRCVYREGFGADGNRMYIDELAHFIACTEGRDSPSPGLREAAAVLAIALAAKRSAAENSMISLGSPERTVE